jgi:tetratricopeptide (TPR) repeat protein
MTRRNPTSHDHGSGTDLAVQARRLLVGLQAPQLAAFLDAWPSATARRRLAPEGIPALRHLSAASAGAPPFSAAFVSAFAAAAQTLAWRRSYTQAEVGADFLDNYGWTELIGLKGPVPSDRLACGVLLLGPRVVYPPHHHEAEEIYVPLSGAAQWRHGDEPWRQLAPGTVIHHLPNASHAMRTGEAPLLALYVWRSKDLAQESRLDTLEPIAVMLARARALAAVADDDSAKLAYIELLRLDPANVAALNELGNLALSGGFRSAARTAYLQAIRHHPANPLVRVNLGNLLVLEQDAEGARAQYQAALDADPEFAEAHRGMGTILQDSEPDKAQWHLQRAFPAGAAVTQPYRGKGRGTPLLLLVSARGGNIPVQQWIGDRHFAITALYMEFWQSGQPLPPYALLVNAIGDADRCVVALARAGDLVKQVSVPVINRPEYVALTGRVDTARRLAGIADVIAPRTRIISPQALRNAPDLEFPLLLRRPGYHTGQYFVRVDAPVDLPAAVESLGASPLLAIQYLDARGADRMARKYRVVFVDGGMYPVHLAISGDWKVHYFTAQMAHSAAYRDEERRFLDNMPAVLGQRAISALANIQAVLRLDYAGVDFALAADGRVLLFEANATMVVAPPGPEAIWDYRRPAIDAVLDASRRMLLRR